MAKTVGTITGKLACNLRLKTPLRGHRLWIAGRLIRAAAFVLGGKMIVDVEPELTMSAGDKPYKTESLPSIGTFIGNAYASGH